jgi:SAM-dependent methyltransferase
VSADIFAGQPTDPDLLAELYDLEHDDETADFGFYRAMARRSGRSVLDLGCGSGRLFGPLIAGGATVIAGVDGSPALLRRARERIAGDQRLAEAQAAGRVRLVEGDVRRLRALDLGRRFSLVLAVGVVPHLEGPDDLLRMLSGIRRLLTPRGRLVIDNIGPGQLPTRDLPLSVDWQRELRGREVVRRSQLMRQEAPEGLRVAFATMVDAVQPDGTIARLPASHRLWYPSHEALSELVRQAGLAVEQAFGSHDLEPLDTEAERSILIIQRAAA